MVDFVFLPLLGLSPIGLHLFKRREFITTLTDDNAIAAAANDGVGANLSMEKVGPLPGGFRECCRGMPKLGYS